MLAFAPTRSAKATVWVPMLGPHVDGNVAGAQKLVEQLNFGLAPLTVKVERTPDVGIVAIVHEQAAPAPLDRHMTADLPYTSLAPSCA